MFHQQYPATFRREVDQFFSHILVSRLVFSITLWSQKQISFLSHTLSSEVDQFFSSHTLMSEIDQFSFCGQKQISFLSHFVIKIDLFSQLDFIVKSGLVSSHFEVRSISVFSVTNCSQKYINFLSHTLESEVDQFSSHTLQSEVY